MKFTYRYLETQNMYVLFADGQPFCTRPTLVELVVIVDKVYKHGVIACWK
jgi:hypothetical protein